MDPQRIQLLIYVNLDPLPGAMHTPEDAKDRIENILNSSIPHYKPAVVIKKEAAANE